MTITSLNTSQASVVHQIHFSSISGTSDTSITLQGLSEYTPGISITPLKHQIHH